MNNHTLAIIGGGASATLLLTHLDHLAPDLPLSVIVFDRAGLFARGIAYSTPHLCHLLNVRAANMSALADDKDDFARWAAQRDYSGQDFVPRRLYGDYLAEKLAAAQRTFDIRLVRNDVLDCRRAARGYVIETNDGAHSFDSVVQATGNAVGLRPVVEGAVRHYYDSPWDVDYAALADLKTILVIGTGLSAVDAVLALHHHGYQGRVVMISRHGLLPGMHVTAPALPPCLMDLPATPLQALCRIRRAVRHSAAPWQAVIDSLRGQTNAIWQAWPDAARDRFMTSLFTLWNIHRHRMAPEIAAVLDEWRGQGRLEIRCARVESVSPGPLARTIRGDIPADAIINCLGYRYHERAFAHDACLGPPCFGPLLETTAIPEIRGQAAVLAAEIVRKVKGLD